MAPERDQSHQRGRDTVASTVGKRFAIKGAVAQDGRSCVREARKCNGCSTIAGSGVLLVVIFPEEAG